MIRSQFYLKNIIFDILSLIHKKEEVWMDGTHPMLFILSYVSGNSHSENSSISLAEKYVCTQELEK